MMWCGGVEVAWACPTGVSSGFEEDLRMSCTECDETAVGTARHASLDIRKELETSRCELEIHTFEV